MESYAALTNLSERIAHHGLDWTLTVVLVAVDQHATTTAFYIDTISVYLCWINFVIQQWSRASNHSSVCVGLFCLEW